MKEQLIVRTDPQPIIRKNAEQNREWPYKTVADLWYPRLEEIKRRFFDGVLKPWDISPLPKLPIAIENMRNYRVLASYKLVPDGYGLNDKLTLNSDHFIIENNSWVWDYGGDWGLAETIVHEVAHGWHKHKGKTKPSHNKEFTNKLLELGIHCDEQGCHPQVAEENSPFGILMKEWGISRPEMQDTKGEDWFWLWAEKEGKGRKGKSSLYNWVCPDCGIHARMGIKGDPELVHDPCSLKKGEKVFFVRAIGMLRMNNEK